MWACCLAALLLPCAPGRKLVRGKSVTGSKVDLAAGGLAELACSLPVTSSRGTQLHGVSIRAWPGWGLLWTLPGGLETAAGEWGDPGKRKLEEGDCGTLPSEAESCHGQRGSVETSPSVQARGRGRTSPQFWRCCCDLCVQLCVSIA